MRHLLLLLLTPTSLLTAGCGNECSFHERCAGAVREICGEADQVVGREVERVPCEAPSGVCVEVEDATLCVEEPAKTCERKTYAPACEGDLLRTCEGVDFTEPVDFPTHYVVATDCAAEGKKCSVASGRAQCE